MTKIGTVLHVAATVLAVVLPSACRGTGTQGAPDASAGGDVGAPSDGGAALEAAPDARDASVEGSATDAGGGDASVEGSATDASGRDASVEASPTDAGGDADALPPLPPDNPIGVDMPDLLRLYLGISPGGASSAQHEMDLARTRGFTHARIEAGQFWPAELQGATGWQSNPTAYFAAFDALMSDARARGFRLVPSLLWLSFLFPDTVGEPQGQLFVPGSKSRTLAEQYITQVVTRYASDDAVLYWEVGNELNLAADTDYSGCVGSSPPSYCYIAPSLGSPASRSSADDYLSCNACLGISTAQQDLGEFMSSMATLIHGIDPEHPLSSGYADLTPNAYHAAHTPCPPCDYTQDTPPQYDEMLGLLHPAGIDVISAHHYPYLGPFRFGDTDPAGAAFIAHTLSVARGLGKTLFVGEWGEPNAGFSTCDGVTESCGGDATRAFSNAVLDALTANEVPSSGLWAYEDYPGCAGVPSCYTVVDTDPLVGAMVTHASAYGSCAGRADGTACPIGSCAAQHCVSPAQPPAPTTVQTYVLQTSADTTGWVMFTNCTGCAPGTFSVMGTSPTTYVDLTSNALPCTGTCSYPGVYAASPPLPLTSGTAVVAFSARTSVPTGAVISVLSFDASGTENGETDVAVEVGTSFAAGGGALNLPTGTATVGLRAALLTPNATLDIAGLTLLSQTSP